MYNCGLSMCQECISVFCVILLIINVRVTQVEQELDWMSQAGEFSVLRTDCIQEGFSPSPPSNNYFFSTKEKPKKRNEKECPSRLTELRAVCQGLRGENTLFAERQRNKKEDFLRSNPKGLTFTNNRNGVIFAFHFYFF